MSKQCLCYSEAVLPGLLCKHLHCHQLSRGKKKGRGKKHLSEQSGEIQPLSPILAPENDDETGLLAWPATTFLTLHRQETKSLETKGTVSEGGSSDQERRKHTGLMGGGGEEQPIYPDL